MLSEIFWLFKYGPMLFNLIKGIKDFIKGIKNPAVHAQAIQELTSAFRAVTATGSTGPLHKIIDKWADRASGVANVTGVVSDRL